MMNLARKIERSESLHEAGTVRRVSDGRFTVETERGEREARRAASCLMEPRVGDLVLVSGVHRGAIYILSVLEKAEGAPTEIVVDGDLAIKLPRGALGVVTQGGVNVASAKDVSVVSGGLRVNAVHGSVVIQTLSLLGTAALAEIATIKVVAGAFDAVLDRVSQTVKRAYRVVEEIDQVRAEQIDYAARKNLRLHAENALVTAEALVKVDGEQIHIG